MGDVPDLNEARLLLFEYLVHSMIDLEREIPHVIVKRYGHRLSVKFTNYRYKVLGWFYPEHFFAVNNS